MSKHPVIADMVVTDDDFVVARAAGSVAPEWINRTMGFESLSASNPALEAALADLCGRFAPEELAALADTLLETTRGRVGRGRRRHGIPVEAEQAAREWAGRIAAAERGGEKPKVVKAMLGDAIGIVHALLPPSASEDARRERAEALLREVRGLGEK